MNKTIKLTLITFLVLFGLFSAVNYCCKAYSDPRQYLEFARSLAKGDYYFNYLPEQILFDHFPENQFQTGFFAHIIKEHKSFSFVSIGYPLFLSAFIALGGIFAPFFVNTLVFIAFFIVIYLFTGLIFRENKYREYISLLTVLLYFFIHKRHIVYLLTPYRDPLAYLFILGGLCFYLRFFHRQSKRSLILAAFFIGLACTVRETSILCLIPMGIFYVAKYIKDRQLSFFKNILVFMLFFTIGILPLLVQNYINSKNPFYPTQILYGDILAPSSFENETLQRSYAVPGMHLVCLFKTSKRIIFGLWRKYNFFLTLLFLLALIQGRKIAGIKYFLLPFIIIYFIFYSFYYTGPWRYMFVVHMAVVPIIAFGVVELFKKIKIRERYLLLGVCLFSFFVFYGMFSKIPQKSFQVKQAKHFKEDFEKVVPSGSVIIAERQMREIIDYFTDSYCFRISDFLRPEYGVDLKTGMDFFFKNFKNVYYFDNFHPGTQDKLYIPTAGQKILKYFNLVPFAKFEGDNYNLAGLFGKKVCTLSRIEEWEDKSVVQSVETVEAKDSILQINARALWNNNYERNWAKLYFDDYLMSDSMVNGLNYFYLPKDLLRKAESTIKIISDAPFPQDVFPQVFDIYDDIWMQAGNDAPALDKFYLSDHFYRVPLKNKPYRAIDKEGIIKIPTVKTEESELFVKLFLRFSKSPHQKKEKSQIDLYLNNRKFKTFCLTRVNQWENFLFRLPADLINKDISELKIVTDLFSYTDEEIARKKMDKLVCLDAVAIKRFKKRSSLIFETERNKKYFLFVEAIKNVKDFSRKEVILSLNGRKSTHRIEGGINFLYLPVIETGEHKVRLNESDFVYGKAKLLAMDKFFVDLGGRDGPFVISGFYGREKYIDKFPFRWTKEKALLRLPTPYQKRAILRLRVYPRPKHIPPAKGKLYLNDNEIGIFEVRENPQIFEYHILPEYVTKEMSTLKIMSSTWNPKRRLRFRSKDARDLGIMLDWVEIVYN